MPQLTVTLEGKLTFIWDDRLAAMLDLGKPSVRRASHVEPTDNGEWTADLSPVSGPLLGPFKLRAEALSAELEYLAGIGY